MNNEKLTIENDICHLIVGNIADIGKPINEATAAQKLTDYFRITHLNPNDDKLIFGQLFGLNSIKAFIQKIDDYNDLEPEFRIEGIRFYNAMSVRSYLPEPDDKSLLPDIILIPVLANGNDLYKVRQLRDPEMGLGDGMPCPNQCQTGFYRE